jgi:hypothetical protein
VFESYTTLLLVLNVYMSEPLQTNGTQDLDEFSQLIKNFDVVVKTYKRAIASVEQGNSHEAASKLTEGMVALRNLTVDSESVLQNQKTLLSQKTAQNLIGLVHQEFLSKNIGRKVSVSGLTLIVLPITAIFSDGAKGVFVTVNGEIHRTNDPVRITEIILSELRKPFKVEVFGKNLIEAYDLISRGKSGDIIHLDEIRQLFSLSRDSGARYSTEQFNADLQQFYCGGIQELNNRMIELVSIAAARQKFQIFIETENTISSVNASAIMISQKRETNHD